MLDRMESAGTTIKLSGDDATGLTAEERAGAGRPHAMMAAPLARRIAAYLVVLVGYLFYCYDFNVVDYVRPYLVSDYGFSLSQTANLSIAQNIGVTAGAFGWASFVAWAGKRRAVGAIAAAIGGAAVLQALATGFPLWFGVRGLMSAALGGYYVIATGLVVALFPVGVRGRLIALNSAMYPLSNIALGLVGGALGDARWHLLMWLGAAPLLIAPLATLLVPRDDGPPAAAGPEHRAPAGAASGGWREMLSARWRWITIGCILLSGIDFNAYQLFAGFVTLYLKQVLGYDATRIGATVAWLGTGSLGGSFAWAWVSDRFGRRSAAGGYVLAAAAIGVFLFGGLSGWALDGAALTFGIGLSCTSAWGVWFAELFPERLRSHGAALFHAGHIFAMGAPLFIAAFSERFGLTWIMALGAIAYLVGTAVWLTLPETLGRETAET